LSLIQVFYQIGKGAAGRQIVPDGLEIK